MCSSFRCYMTRLKNTTKMIPKENSQINQRQTPPLHQSLHLLIKVSTVPIKTRISSIKLTVLKLQNLGHPNTNCTASNKLLFPLPFLPTTQFISGEKGWISGCCLKERKLDRVTDLMCILTVWCYVVVDVCIILVSA